MISGIVPFEEIVQSVKDETGIENIRPYYEKIRRLIFRGEREIGYGGSVALFKKTYLIAGLTSIDPNFGKYFQFPENFIEFEGVGQECRIVNNLKYRATLDGFRFKEKQTLDTVLLYWGLSVDENGYPYVTRNHEEAVVAYIVWKLYSYKIFLGIGNMNAAQDYKRTFELAVGEARGDDAFPTLEEWNALGQLSYTDRRILLDIPVHSYDYCAEYENEIAEEEEGPITPPSQKNVHFWVNDSLTDELAQIIPLVNPTYLLSKDFRTLAVFANLVVVDNMPPNPDAALGRIVFAITNTTNISYMIYDQFNNIINDLFDEHYYSDTNIKIYVSKAVYSYFELSFKINTL